MMYVGFSLTYSEFVIMKSASLEVSATTMNWVSVSIKNEKEDSDQMHWIKSSGETKKSLKIVGVFVSETTETNYNTYASSGDT